jgi:hypothetical protein
MALFKDSRYFKQSHDRAFDVDYNPGGATPHSGIYRCMGCGREIVSEEGRPFPPQNHHQHSVAQGRIRWRLIAYADHKPK